ncbi:MAG: hypothetical protein IH878_15635 [Gemmatimonadetes bacterium]|nr:hypothetical protein [Gemmatimonadota bacterium]
MRQPDHIVRIPLPDQDGLDNDIKSTWRFSKAIVSASPLKADIPRPNVRSWD